MAFSRPWMFFGLALMASGAAMLVWQDRMSHAAAELPPKIADSSLHDAWKSLFDGKTLGSWKPIPFGGEGKVHVADGQLVMDEGTMTGVVYTGRELLRDDYELSLEGIRLEGSDFFCTTTFPVGKEYCSLVVGGWGGLLVGLSSVDGADASENDTSTVQDLKNDIWYRVRIRVTPAVIDAWINDRQVVHKPREGHRFSTRVEVDACQPLGIATWATKGAVKNIRIRSLEKQTSKP
ncbi:MAG: DUF1080 domain-containing protein [Planctomycetaceae bacterium]|nr:DUF1080 domain-containing protein [Planctomycetaceae bacterium]